MRILFFSVSDQLGGSEVALVDMIASLADARPSWVVGLILPGGGPLLRRAEAAGADCTLLAMPPSLARAGEFAATASGSRMAARAALAASLFAAAGSLPGYLRRLRLAVRAFRPSILHTNGVKAHVLGARANGPAKLVWHLHEYVGGRAVTKRLLAAHAGRAAAIVANSNDVAADARRALPDAVAPEVVHNAVDLAAFSPHGASEDLDVRAGMPPAPPGTVRVGLVATFARWKGHEVFLEAISMLPSTLPVRAYVVGDAVYTTAGSQYSRDELLQVARRFGIADRVGFTGFLPAPAAMRALDVVVHASDRPEPFGLAIAEAMACGRAVVTSACGGAAELVRADVDALTHPPGDAATLSKQIARLAGDATFRHQLGEQARIAARQRFDPSRLGRQLASLYERIA